MSLEATIAENTSAIRELIAALAHGVPTTSAQLQKVAEQAKTESTPESSPSPAADVAQEPAAAQAVPTYPDVVAAINKLGGAKGRDSVIDLLKTFGATKGPDLKPEQFADFIAKAAI